MITTAWIRGAVLLIALLAPGGPNAAPRTGSRAPGDSLAIPIVDIVNPPGGSLLDRTQLMAQHSSESPTVIYHLHVMALERLVLEKLGKQDELNYLDQLYRTDPPPGDYRRAWEIVNATGPAAFLRELRAMPR